MSRIVIGHKDGKPIYRDEGPNRGLLTVNDPQRIGSDLVIKRTGDATGLPTDKRALPWWRKER